MYQKSYRRRGTAATDPVELLDAIYYLTREVARLEDQRRKLAASGGDEQ